jgi:hypothetical protein
MTLLSAPSVRAWIRPLPPGDSLIEAKQLLPHGGWLPWLSKHCGLSARVAQNYMLLARHKKLIPAKYESDSYLTITAALASVVRDAELIEKIKAEKGKAEAYEGKAEAELVKAEAELIKLAKTKTKRELRERLNQTRQRIKAL